MKWHWFVEWVRGEDTGRISSKEGWDTKEKANFNLEARMSQTPPNIPKLPVTAAIVDFGVELKS